MPFVSDAQRRLMYAAAMGKLKKKGGPSKEVAEKFIRDSGDPLPKEPSND